MLFDLKYIIQKDNLFIIQRKINNVLVDFGSFETLDEAISHRNELDRDGWPIRINNNEKNSFRNNHFSSYDISNKDMYFQILEIYNSIGLISEPKIPFPQADNLNIFLKICEKLYGCGSLTKPEIMELFTIRPRQCNFYISVGLYLGLLEKYNGSNKLSNYGVEIFSLDDNDEKNLKIVSLILKHKPFYDVFSEYLKKDKLPSANTIFRILKNNKLYNINSDVTLKRRSQTVRSWINWIVNLYI